jgi:hypothetical protein
MQSDEPTHGTFDAELPAHAQHTGVECDLCEEIYKEVDNTYVCPNCLFMPDVTYEQREPTDEWAEFEAYRQLRATEHDDRLRAVGGFPRPYTYD